MESTGHTKPRQPPILLSPTDRSTWRQWRTRLWDKPTRRRSASFTTEGTRYVFFTLAVGIAAINTGNNLFYLLVAMMLSLIMLSGLLSELCLRKLSISCHAPAFVYADSDSALTLVLTNGKRRFPSLSLRLVAVVGETLEDPPAQVKVLPPGGSVIASCTLHPTKRGYLALHGFQIATPFPFGLFVKRAFHAHRATIVVLPKPQPLPVSTLTALAASGHAQPSGQKGPGADLYNLRLYHPGDDSRLIHWMSTARTSQLIVRETETDHTPRITIRLSTIAPAESAQQLERAVVFAASLIALALRSGFRILVCAGEHQATSGRGMEDLPHLLTPLALCTRSWPPGEGPPEPPSRDEDEWRHAGASEYVILPWTSPDLERHYAQATVRFDQTTPDMDRVSAA